MAKRLSCGRSASRRLAVASAAILLLTSASDARAQNTAPQPAGASQQRALTAAPAGSADFLFGAPRAWIGFRGSYLVPRAGGDLFTFIGDQLTLGRKDFRTHGVAADLGVVLAPRVEVVAGIDVNRHQTGSEYRHFIGSNQKPITQNTRLEQTSMSAGIRVSPLGRGRSISRYAFIPRRLVPYVGAGVTMEYYSFLQRGQFVDAADLSVFGDQFTSDGWTTGPYLHGGADLQVWKHLFLTVEGRYTWLHGDLDSDFSGFDGIDLAGFRGGTGISIVF